MTTVSLRDLMTGDKFSCRIQGVAVTGIVTVGRDYIYLCQNRKNGGLTNSATPEKHGYKYTWIVVKRGTNEGQELAFTQQAVTMFRVTKAVPRPVKIAKPLPAPKKVKKVAAILGGQGAPAVGILGSFAAQVNIDEEIAQSEKRLADLKAKKAREAEPILLDTWEIRKKTVNGNKDKVEYHIGCGAVIVTPKEAAVVANVLHQMLTRGAYGDDVKGTFREKVKRTLKVAAKLGKVPHFAL
jgi:hypothetical protein